MADPERIRSVLAEPLAQAFRVTINRPPSDAEMPPRSKLCSRSSIRPGTDTRLVHPANEVEESRSGEVLTTV